MNNCKIANELRKYRDLTGCINRVRLSDDPENFAEYVITGEVSYLDMVTANAVYSLWRSAEGINGFRAETVAQVMAGDASRRLRPKKQEEIEAQLQRLAGIELYILADHDQQAKQQVYEGPLLPLEWETDRSRPRFYFRPLVPMPLYQYAEERNQLIRVSLRQLQDDQQTGQTRRNNNDRTLLLRHYLLQELEILRYPSNRVEKREIRLLKQDEAGEEYGLLWTLGLLEEGKNPLVTARNVQQTIVQLLDNWRRGGYVTTEQYELLSMEKGYGVTLLQCDNKTEKKKRKSKSK